MWGAQLALELDQDDVQGVNVRMSGEALFHVVRAGWAPGSGGEWGLGNGCGLGEAHGVLKGRGPRCGQQGAILRGSGEDPPFPASRPHLIGTTHPGQLATSICPECPIRVGPCLLPPSALGIVASQEIAARLGTPVSWGPALLLGGCSGLASPALAALGEPCSQGRGLHSAASSGSPSWGLTPAPPHALLTQLL